ncbi:MAG: hypothetical protein ACFN1A_03220 [Corynebacterium matruchotii]|uniref:hypothetical protein n=1 Tax=Corynebacterium matruchotii TaxID=43768 RepID=UPI003609FE2C
METRYTDTVTAEKLRPPAVVRWAAIIAIIQSAIGLGFAIILIVREATGQTDPNLVYESAHANRWVGYGTAVFFIIIFGAVAAGAMMMFTARRWGRGPVIMLELFLLVAATYMFNAQQYSLSLATAASALLGLGLLFNPRAISWAAQHY